MRALLILIGLGILATSCDKVVAEDITEDTPVLILPSVNDTVNQNPVHFKWEELEGASKYHLEVVSPSFTSISSYPLDTIVTGTDFFYDLDSNEYELRLTALNGGYESQILGPVKFWVGVQPSGGTGGSVVLDYPADGAYENAQFSNGFSWIPVSGATSYEFSIRQGSDFSTGTEIEAQNGIFTSNYTVPSGLLSEGEYQWGVKAYFGAVETPFTIHQLLIDETDPNLAILTNPGDLTSVQQGTITFSWSNGTDVGTVQSPITSTLEIATDAAFGAISNTVSIIGNTTDVDLTPDTYYWRVTNTDEAGNSAGVSAVNQVTVTL
ncbi:MAG: hypothetical protein HWE22_05455 [Flavobacteriales bacterium]|nr:hypothetical protein [Flavobacteriales bacterium]